MKQGERGLTLIELAVTVAIVALIAAGANMSIFQVLKGTERNNDHMTAVNQVQKAGYWVSRDTQMAQSVDTINDPETPEDEFITLQWTNWENGDVHKIVYTFHDMAGGLKKLKRQYVIHDASGVETGNAITLVAEYISSASFSEQDSTWKLTVRAQPGTGTETREYEVKPRVNM